MARAGIWIGEGLHVMGALLLIVVSIPLLILAAIFFRPLLIVAVVGGLVLAIFSRRFRAWFNQPEPLAAQYARYQGLRLPTDVTVHPCHSWARIRGKKADVGVDDLVQSTLGPVEQVELPEIGSSCRQGDPLFTLRCGDRVLHVRSPVSGTVEAVNRQLLSAPELVNRTPFTEGWAVRMRAEQMEPDSRTLLRGKEASQWFRREVDRLISSLLTCHVIGPALPDGGELAGDLHTQIDDRAWQTLVQGFFDTPAVLNQPQQEASSPPR